MRNHLLGAALSFALTLLSLPPAHAEIYTWVDAQGRLNVGNLPPPEGARVTSVVRETPPNPYNDAAREAAQRAEVQALAQRVDQLQNELQWAARQPPPPPPPPQYLIVPVSAPVQYITEPAPPQNAECAYGWSSCAGWWNPGFPPVSTVFVAPSPVRAYPWRGGRGGHGRGAHDGNGGRGGQGSIYGPPSRPPMKFTALQRP